MNTSSFAVLCVDFAFFAVWISSPRTTSRKGGEVYAKNRKGLECQLT